MTDALPPLNRQTAQTPLRYPERVVQFGGGNFLRAFIDWIIETLNEQADFASSVVIVKPTPQGTYAQFDAQDCLFHVQMHGIQDRALLTERKLITCVSRTINPYADYEVFMALACQPEIRFIVSNTTEAGLTFAPGDQVSDAPPASFPAKLTAFLYRRFQHFQGDPQKGCIVLPCELVEGNGNLLMELVLQYADQWALGDNFKRWIQDNNRFCNTLVDRIVPGFPSANADETLKQIGFDDPLLVEAERYHSWIIEAPDLLARELPVHKTNLNIKLVDDVEPYRKEKVRILNGAHTAMMAIGYLLGLETVQQAVTHPQLGVFIRDLLYKEVIPSFATSDEHLESFAGEIFNRFQNPFIQHRLLSIALNSISKFKVRLLPTLIDYEATCHRLPRRVVFAFAALLRFYKGDWNANTIPVKDDPAVVAWIQDQWRSSPSLSALVETVLENEPLWGQDLTKIDTLVELLTNDLSRIDAEGVDAAMQNQDW